MWTVFAVLLIIVLLIVNTIRYQLEVYDEVLEDYKDNWMIKPINDIKSSLETWPNGYEDIISSMWTNIFEVCDCTNSEEYFHEELGPSSWSVNQVFSGCKTVFSTRVIDINLFYSYRIWARRSKDFYSDVYRKATKEAKLQMEWK